MVAQTDVAGLPAEFGPGTVLLDVREDDEWQRGHAADARHIPMGEVPARLNEIDPQAKLYVICKAGGRSQKVAQFWPATGMNPSTSVAGCWHGPAPDARSSPMTAAPAASDGPSHEHQRRAAGFDS